MPEGFTETRNLMGDIFEDIAAEELAAEEPAEEEEVVEEEVSEPADGVKEEEEPTSDEEEEETEDDDLDDGELEDEEEEDEETEELEVDKPEKEEYNGPPEVHSVTIDGEDIKVDTEELRRGYQKAESSDRRFKEASQMKKDTQTFWKNILENPGEALVDRITDEFCGGDRVKARFNVVEALLEWMTPEREAAKIEDEKERNLYRRERDMELRQREIDRQGEKTQARVEQVADEEFSKNLQEELNKAFAKNSLPNQAAIWNRTGKLLQEFEDELPGSIRDDTEAMRREVIKNSSVIVDQVARERNETKAALKSTLSKDELAELYPELKDALKQTKIDRVKKKRSKKKKGNAAKAKQELDEKKQKVGAQSTGPQRSDDVFRDLDDF